MGLDILVIGMWGEGLCHCQGLLLCDCAKSNLKGRRQVGIRVPYATCVLPWQLCYLGDHSDHVTMVTMLVM